MCNYIKQKLKLGYKTETLTLFGWFGLVILLIITI